MQKEEFSEDGEQELADRLTAVQRGWRAGLVGVMVAGLLLLKFVNPAEGGFSFSSPITQRLFGLPCPFCGMTRGTHALLNGELLQALYLNLATGLALAVAVILIVVWGFEASRGRVVGWFMPIVNAIFCRWKWLAGVLVLFWLVHLSMALILPKQELLDVEAPLFPDFLLKESISN